MKAIDWDKPLQIKTRKGTFNVFNLGIGWKGKRIVQIEDDPSRDGSIPQVFNPDDGGYVCQFDSYIQNVEMGLPIGFIFPLSKYEVWTECVNALREQGWQITKT